MPDETIWIVTAATSDESPQLVTADGGKTALGMGGVPFLDVDALPNSSTPPKVAKETGSPRDRWKLTTEGRILLTEATASKLTTLCEYVEI